MPVIALAVEEDHRGRGHGRSLMRHLIEGARRNGVSRLDLTVSPANEAATSLYRSLGFTELPSADRLMRMTL